MSLYEEEMEPDDDDLDVPPKMVELILPSGRRLSTSAFNRVEFLHEPSRIGAPFSLRATDEVLTFTSRHATMEEAEMALLALIQFSENCFKVAAISSIGGCPCCQDEG